MRHGHHDCISKAWKRSEYVDKNYKIFGESVDHLSEITEIFDLTKLIHLDSQWNYP